jgi:hypothetical protein
MRKPIAPKTTSRASSGITGTAGKFVNSVYKNIATVMIDPTKIIKKLSSVPKKTKK